VGPYAGARGGDAGDPGRQQGAAEGGDPVVYMEHKSLWPSEGEVPDDDHVVPFGVARRSREGGDITIVSWSRMVHLADQAADELAASGIGAEIIDLRTLWPWDEDMVCESVSRTGRLLVVHEAVQAGGFGAEVIATVVERLGSGLRVPPRRLGGPRIPIAYSKPLEDEFCVPVARIVATVREMMEGEIT